MFDFFATPLFGILISIAAYLAGKKLQQKTGLSFLPPVLIAYILIIMVLVIFRIPVEKYDVGGAMIDFFLAPVTIVLAVPLYRQLQLVKKGFVALVVGVVTGVVACFAVVYLSVRLFSLDNELLLSLLPKSITTPMALAVSESLGGIKGITALSVVLSGVIGAALGPLVFKLFGIESRPAKGIGLGCSAHALGTTRALELGEIEGAFSGASLFLTGVLTVILIPVIIKLTEFFL